MSDEAQALTPFRSNAEMTAAIQDPRYAKDEAYRQDVMDRMTKTDGTQQSSTPAAPFRSGAEMTAAMQDPRYAKDEAYRQDVMDRVAAGSAAPTPPGGAPAASPFYEVTGGRAQFLEAKHRLTQQATAADRQRWNDAIDSGDTATIRGLIAAYPPR